MPRVCPASCPGLASAPLQPIRPTLVITDEWVKVGKSQQKDPYTFSGVTSNLYHIYKYTIYTMVCPKVCGITWYTNSIWTSHSRFCYFFVVLGKSIFPLHLGTRMRGFVHSGLTCLWCFISKFIPVVLCGIKVRALWGHIRILTPTLANDVLLDRALCKDIVRVGQV